MTATTSNEFIEPSLADAIKHWNEYSAENAKNALIVLEAITPLKDALQVSEQVVEAMKQTNWFPVGTTLANPGVLTDAYKELAEIQMAALGKWYDGYAQFLKTTQQSGEKFTAALQDVNSPQQALAGYLETSLAVTKQYQADASDQASNLSAVQAAYKAWFQKTLQSLSAKS